MSDQVVYAPNIHLFAYHLQTHKNPYQLYKKCNEILEKLKITDFNLHQRVNLSQDSENFRADLLKESEIKNDNISPPFAGKFFIDNKTIKFEGFAYPLRIHDSYALALNIRCPEEDENHQKTEDVNIALLKQFNPDNCLLPDFIDSSLGQTLLITAWLPEELRQLYCEYWQYPDDEQKLSTLGLRELADRCLKNLIADSQKKSKLYRQGVLFGSPIFEYGIAGDRTAEQPILIWLFCRSETDRKLADCYQDLIDLFCYQNKIIQSYQDSRKINLLLDADYQQIEQEIDKFEEIIKNDHLNENDLQQLQTQLKTLAKIASGYARLLRDLQEKQHTISINTRNYVEKLRIIRNKVEQEYSYWLGNNISFLEEFNRKKCRQFQEQIQAYLGYYMHGSGLVDKAIASIRGIVEIEQARIDHQRQEEEKAVRNALEKTQADMQNSITAIGTGIAAGSFFASSSGLITEPWRMPWDKDHSVYPHPFLLSLLFSIIIALAAWWGMKQWQVMKR